MALDVDLLSALSEELSRNLLDGRVEKIQQPEKDLLLLTIRSSGENRKLLIRAAGPNARVHLTEQSFENPKEAPMFCMFLRKHLMGARIRSVEQLNGDRLISFFLEGRNEMGDSVSFRLWFSCVKGWSERNTSPSHPQASPARIVTPYTVFALSE